MAQTCSRYCYLVEHYRRLRGPEMIAVASHFPQVRTRQLPPTALISLGLKQLQTPPNLALLFGTLGESLSIKLPRYLPKDAVILEAVAGAIQSSIDGVLECKSSDAMMLGRLSSAVLQPFCWEANELRNMEAIVDGFVNDQLDAETDWRVFLVYACGAGTGEADACVARLQARFPHSAIIGGICTSGAVSVETVATTKEELAEMSSLELIHLNRCLGGQELRSANGKAHLVDCVYQALHSAKYCLHMVEDGIFGVAMGGDVPVRSVVSRGVRSLTTGGDPQPSTPLVIESADIHFPGSEDYFFRGDDPPPYHLVHRIKDTSTGRLLSPMELLTKYGQPDLVGVRRAHEDGFDLLMPHPLSFSLNSFLFLIHGDSSTESLKGANLDLFNLDGAACVADMESKMRLLEQQTEGEQVLGAVMYSCGARGPLAGDLIAEDMADAKRFAAKFPSVPCLGFYAGE